MHVVLLHRAVQPRKCAVEFAESGVYHRHCACRHVALAEPESRAFCSTSRASSLRVPSSPGRNRAAKSLLLFSAADSTRGSAPPAQAHIRPAAHTPAPSEDSQSRNPSAPLLPAAQTRARLGNLAPETPPAPTAHDASPATDRLLAPAPSPAAPLRRDGPHGPAQSPAAGTPASSSDRSRSPFDMPPLLRPNPSPARTSRIPTKSASPPAPVRQQSPAPPRDAPSPIHRAAAHQRESGSTHTRPPTPTMPAHNSDRAASRANSIRPPCASLPAVNRFQ